MQPAQQRPQRGHRHLRRPLRHARAGRDHERDDVGRAQPLQTLTARREPRHDERPDEAHVALGGRLADAALGHQVMLEPLQQFLRRRDRPRLRRGNRAQRSQVTQQRLQRVRRFVVRVAGGTAIRRVLLRRPRRQAAGLHARRSHPPAQVRRQGHLLLRSPGRIPLTFQLSGETRRIRLQRTCDQRLQDLDHDTLSSRVIEDSVRRRSGLCRPFHALRGRHQQLPPRGRHNPQVGVMAVMPTSA